MGEEEKTSNVVLNASSKIQNKGEEEIYHPIIDNSWINRMFFVWIFELLRKGMRKPLVEADLWHFPERWHGSQLRARIREMPSSQWLGFKLLRLVLPSWLAAGGFYCLWCVSAAYQPILVQRAVQYLEYPNDQSKGVEIGFALFVNAVAYTLTINWKFHLLGTNGTVMRNAIFALVSEKSSKITLSAQCGVGVATQLITSDAETIFQASLFLHYLWFSNTFVFVVLILAYQALGVSALIGLCVLPVHIWAMGLLGKLLGNLKKKMMVHSDERTQSVSQVLNGVSIVKCYNWEDAMVVQLNALRKLELVNLFKILFTRAIMMSATFMVSGICAVVVFAVHTALGHELTSEQVFMTLSFITILRFPLMLIPRAFGLANEARTSINRIQAFLELPEVGKEWEGLSEEDFGSDTVVVLENAGFTWSNGKVDNGNDAKEGGDGHDNVNGYDAVSAQEIDLINNPFALHNITFRLKRCELIGVVGSVGCGKSSLMQAILGEMTLVAPQSSFRRSTQITAYMPQTSAIFNDTVRENILFGLPYVEEPYRRSLEAACLDHDLSLLDAADLTEIGDRGVNLSGGQRARVSFARCCYRWLLPQDVACGLVLLDDPFAAVDHTVAMRMAQKGLLGVMADAPRVLVLNSHTDLLQHANRVLVVRGGTIVENDTYENLMAKQVPELITRSSPQAEDATDEFGAQGAQEAGTEEEERGGPSSRQKKTTSEIRVRFSSSTGSRATRGGSTRTEERPKKLIQAGTLSVIENRVVGYVSSITMKRYLDPSSPTLGLFALIGVLLAFLITQLVRIGLDLWVTAWACDAQKQAGSNVCGNASFLGASLSGSSSYWTWTSCVWVGSLLVAVIIRSYLSVKFSVRSSRKLHDVAIRALLKAPLLYFQQNPVGRTLNRLSSDLYHVDLPLPDNLYQLFENLFVLLGVLIFACAANVLLIVPLIPCIAFLLYIVYLYRCSSREITRLEAVSRSPLISFLSRGFAMRDTSRAFGVQTIFQQKFDSLAQINSKLYLVKQVTYQFVSTALNTMVACIVLAFMLLLVLGKDVIVIHPSLASLALVYCLQSMGISSYTVKLAIEVEQCLTSVERVLECSDVTPEAAHHLPTDPSPDSWPSAGKIVARNLRLRYRPELPLTLRGVSFSIAPGERIGVCGRTGAGKSTLLLALFRLFEPETGSEIEIDGTPIKGLGLSLLRRALSIIPQEPVVFEGSIRYNLDPFHEASDEALWEALEQVQLEHVVRGLPLGLQENLTDGGSNLLSHGQRQLICLARVLLKRAHCKILVCDEATSSVDYQTDALVQKVIRSCFVGHTIITIAHRLDTILDSDRIMVLGDGRLLEFDAPQTLLGNPKSALSLLGAANEAEKICSDAIAPRVNEINI